MHELLLCSLYAAGCLLLGGLIALRRYLLGPHGGGHPKRQCTGASDFRQNIMNGSGWSG